MLTTNVSRLQKPWPGGDHANLAWRPMCHLCTWVWFGGRFKLKYVNRACHKHGRMLGGAS